VDLLDNDRLNQVSLLGGWEKLAQLTKGQIHNLLLGLIDQRFRRTDHQFHVAAASVAIALLQL